MKERNVNETNMRDPMGMDRILVISQTLSDSHTFLWKRNLKCPTLVASYSDGTHTVFIMKKSTHRRSLMSVMNVEKPLAIVQISSSIKESTPRRNPTNAVSVGRSSGAAHTSSSIRSSTRGRCLTCVMSAEKLSVRAQVSFDIRESTPWRSPVNVPNVGRPSARAQI